MTLDARLALAASTHGDVERAAQALLAGGSTAMDALVGGILALFLREPTSLLGTGNILVGGRGEGQLAIDARARQPGVGKSRPRGFVDEAAAPDLARVAVPWLPTALVLAHTGRGSRTLSEIFRSVAKTSDANKTYGDIEAFAREGGAAFQRGGHFYQPLLRVAPQSLGGMLGIADLEAIRPHTSKPGWASVGGRIWSLCPWSPRVHNALAKAELTPPTGEVVVEPAVEPLDEDDMQVAGETVVLATVDTFGSIALASVFVARHGLPLDGTNVSLPLLGAPVIRSLTRVLPGLALRSSGSIGLARVSAPGVPTLDLALGVGGVGDVEGSFAQVARALRGNITMEQAIALPRMAGKMPESELNQSFGVATGLALAGRPRILRDPRTAP